MKCALLVLMHTATAAPTVADDSANDKSDYTLLNPTPDADLRTFNTDRPPKANSPYTVDAGHFQYESDIAVFGYGTTAGVRTQAWTVLDTTAKLGLTNTIDAELQITPSESVVTGDAGITTTVTGIGDTFARVKINVLGNDQGPVAVALLPYVKLPTAESRLGNGRVEGGLILPVSVSAPGGFTVIVMAEGDYLKNTARTGYHTTFDFLINVSHALDRRWTFYAEAFTAQSSQAGERPIYTLDAALTCMLLANLQLDFGGNFSLNAVAPRAQFYTGLSQRF